MHRKWMTGLDGEQRDNGQTRPRYSWPWGQSLGFGCTPGTQPRQSTLPWPWVMKVLGQNSLPNIRSRRFWGQRPRLFGWWHLLATSAGVKSLSNVKELTVRHIWFIWHLFLSFTDKFVMYGVTIESPIESPMVSPTILNSPGSRVQDWPYRGYLYPPKTNYISSSPWPGYNNVQIYITTASETDIWGRRTSSEAAGAAVAGEIAAWAELWHRIRRRLFRCFNLGGGQGRWWWQWVMMYYAEWRVRDMAGDGLSCNNNFFGMDNHVVEKPVKVIINKSIRCARVARKSDCQHPSTFTRYLPAYIVAL